METPDTEKAIEVYAVGEFISAINRMLKEPTPINIVMVSPESGDVAFTCTLSDMGITSQAFQHPFYRSHLFANMLGELLVRQNIDKFCDRVMDKNYEILVKQYNHTGMGLRLENDEVLKFQFHMSLIYKLINESIAMECADELAISNIISGCKKVKRGEEAPSITSFCDNKNIRLVVTSQSSVMHCFENAIYTILNFYGIKGKVVRINVNMFNYDIEVQDQDKTTSS